MATQMYSAQSPSPTPIPKPEIRSRGLLKFNLGTLVMSETADIRLLTIAFGAADAVAPQSNMPTLGDAVCTPVPVISMASETSRPPRKRSES